MSTLNFQAPGSSASISFTNGFEEGTFALWHNNSANASVQSTVKRTGTYAAKANIPSDAAVAYFEQNLLPQQHYKSTFYIRLNASFNIEGLGSNRYIRVASYRTPANLSSNTYDLGIYEYAANSFRFALYNGITWLTDASTIVLDTWIKIEFEVHCDTGNLDVYVDGFNDGSSIPTGDFVSSIRFGLFDSALNKAGSIAYFDDFIIEAATTSSGGVVDQDIDQYHIGGWVIKFDENQPNTLIVISPNGYQIKMEETEGHILTITTQSGWQFTMDENDATAVTVTSPGGVTITMDEDSPGILNLIGIGGYEITFDEDSNIITIEPPDEEVPPPVVEPPRPSTIFPRGKATIATRGADIIDRKATITRGGAVITKREATIK